MSGFDVITDNVFVRGGVNKVNLNFITSFFNNELDEFYNRYEN